MTEKIYQIETHTVHYVYSVDDDKEIDIAFDSYEDALDYIKELES